MRSLLDDTRTRATSTSAHVPALDQTLVEREALSALAAARARQKRAIALTILLALVPPFLLTPALTRARRAAAAARERAPLPRAPSLERAVVVHAIEALPGQ